MFSMGESCCLDTAGTTTTVPLAATGSGVGVLHVLGASTTLGLAHNPEANKSRSQEEDSSQESKGHVGLVLSACISLSNVAPSPDASTGVVTVEVSQESKGNDPKDEEDQVDWPFGEGAEEWKKEEEREEDGDGSNSDGVDVSLVGRGACSTALVKVFTSEAGDGGAEGEFANAEEERDEICCKHFVFGLYVGYGLMM